jgi:hypothetical protein
MCGAFQGKLAWCCEKWSRFERKLQVWAWKCDYWLKLLMAWMVKKSNSWSKSEHTKWIHFKFQKPSGIFRKLHPFPNRNQAPSQLNIHWKSLIIRTHRTINFNNSSSTSFFMLINRCSSFKRASKSCLVNSPSVLHHLFICLSQLSTFIQRRNLEIVFLST